MKRIDAVLTEEELEQLPEPIQNDITQSIILKYV